jgi:hypothetical protein
MPLPFISQLPIYPCLGEVRKSSTFPTHFSTGQLIKRPHKALLPHGRRSFQTLGFSTCAASLDLEYLNENQVPHDDPNDAGNAGK